MNSKFLVPKRWRTFQNETNVWMEYLKLATQYNPPVNLGQGFPDYACPEHITRALAEVTTGNNPLLNQYSRGYGLPRLVEALSKLYSSLIGRKIDPYNEIVVCGGAFEALIATFLGHIDEGDEVIMIEPFFDVYKNLVKVAGGVAKYVPLRPSIKTGPLTSTDWVLDEEELCGMFNEKTKMIILNTPHNPTGKVFTMEELELIARLCQQHNVLCVSDEVYEWLVFKPKEHIRIAALPNMWERTITIGSAGKSFSVTGWKLGWAYGSADIMKNLHVVHQNFGQYGCTPIQEAVAKTIEFEISRYDKPECYFSSLAEELHTKRDFLIKCLRENGFNPTVPEAGYFIVADWTELGDKLNLSTEMDEHKDFRFMRKFTKDVGILVIPTSAFYSEEHKHLGENYVRFCFVKEDEKLQLAEKILRKWNSS